MWGITENLERREELLRFVHDTRFGLLFTRDTRFYRRIGYHARVYYDGLQPPPPGAQFSAQWGLTRDHGETLGDWVQCDGQKVFDLLKDQVGSPSLDDVADAAQKILDETKDLKEELLSILDSYL